jgi:hypothetical protein
MAAVRACVLLVALATAAALLSSSAAARRARTPRASQTATVPLMGVNISDADTDPPSAAATDISAAHALHAKVVRTEVSWSVMQPSGPSSYDPKALAYLDSVIADASAKGIKVLLLVDSSPCWGTSAPAEIVHKCGTKNSRANGYPPKNPADYAAFVSFLAGRYGAKLAAIEIWNEPDHLNERYFAGPEKARKYAELLKLAYPAIKHASPGVSVIAGSLVGSNGIFLRALYANGIKGFYDGLAVHYYTLTLASVRAIRSVQVANGDTAPLWLDEFGWSNCYPRQLIEAEQACVTAAVQAANLRNALRSLARSSYIAAAVTYKLRDSAEEQFGVITTARAHKRSFAALAQAFGSPFGPVSRTTLHLRRRGSAISATGSGPVGDLMQLVATRGGLRYKATFVLDRFDRYTLKLPRVLGSHHLRVQVYQQWAGLRAAATASIK